MTRAGKGNRKHYWKNLRDSTKAANNRKFGN